MPKIGTDLCLFECRNSGYTVIDFKIKDLFPKGRKNGLNKDAYVSVTRSIPDRWKGGRSIPGYSRHELYCTDTIITWNDVHEIYLKHKESIDKFCDMKNCPIEMDNPTEYDLLNLIDVVDSYCGLD